MGTHCGCVKQGAEEEVKIQAQGNMQPEQGTNVRGSNLEGDFGELMKNLPIGSSLVRVSTQPLSAQDKLLKLGPFRFDTASDIRPYMLASQGITEDDETFFGLWYSPLKVE